MLDKILDKLEPLKAKFCKFHTKRKIERKKKIFVINSATINIHFGGYCLSAVLLIMGYIVSQRR